MGSKQPRLADKDELVGNTRPARRSCRRTGSTSHRRFRPIQWLFKTLGPGLITGASDDDPSGIGTYSLTGASLGYAPLWLALATFPLMAVVQYICAKIGLVCGCGIAGVLRQHYSRKILYSVVLTLGDRQHDQRGRRYRRHRCRREPAGPYSDHLADPPGWPVDPGPSDLGFVSPDRAIFNGWRWPTLAYVGAAFFGAAPIGRRCCAGPLCRPSPSTAIIW